MGEIGRTKRRECPEHGWPEWANMADDARCPKCERELVAVEYVLVPAEELRGAVEALRDARQALAQVADTPGLTRRRRLARAASADVSVALDRLGGQS